MTYLVAQHEVTVAKIRAVAPLLGPNGQLVSPEVGLKMLLENGDTTKWLCESGSPAPAPGDYFVRDAVLNVSYLVSQAKFAELFEAEE